MRSKSIARLAFLLVCSCTLAFANTAGADETVEAFVARYELALDRGDPELLRAVYEDWSPEKAGRLREYFTETDGSCK